MKASVESVIAPVTSFFVVASYKAIVANSTGALFVLPLKIPVTLLPFPAANTIVIQQMTTMPKTNLFIPFLSFISKF